VELHEVPGRPDGTSRKAVRPNTVPAKLAGDIALLLSDAAA